MHSEPYCVPAFSLLLSACLSKILTTNKDPETLSRECLSCILIYTFITLSARFVPMKCVSSAGKHLELHLNRPYGRGFYSRAKQLHCVFQIAHSMKASPLTLTSRGWKGVPQMAKTKKSKKFNLKVIAESLKPRRGPRRKEVFQLFAGLKMQHTIASAFCVKSALGFPYNRREEKEATWASEQHAKNWDFLFTCQP